MTSPVHLGKLFRTIAFLECFYLFFFEVPNCSFHFVVPGALHILFRSQRLLTTFPKTGCNGVAF